MLQVKNLKYALFTAAVLMMSACSHQEKVADEAVVPPEVVTVPSAPRTETSHYTVLEFATGETVLSSSEQEKIKNLSRAALRYGRPISEIRVLAWSDNLELKEPTLAAQRASQVHSLVKTDLKSKARVSVYNMSEQPQVFADLIREKDPKQKLTFENTEAPSFGKGPKSSLAGNKTSKAIVMVRYE